MSLVVAMRGVLSFAGRAQSIIRVGNARFTVIAPECIRMEHSPTGEFVDAPLIGGIACVGNGAARIPHHKCGNKCHGGSRQSHERIEHGLY